MKPCSIAGLRPVRAEPQLTIVVPCYQEAQVLPDFHRRIRAVMNTMHLPCELLYVDDGCTDRTPELLDAFAGEAGVRCVRLSRNFGKEAAMCAGLDHARGTAVLFIDADLQDPPELVPLMVEHWLAGHDIVNMQRLRRLGDSWLKRATAGIYYRLMERLVDRIKWPRQVSDFRLLGPAPLAALRGLPERGRMLKGMISWIGFSTIEVPYVRAARGAGATKWNYLGLIDLAIEGVLGLSRKPLRWYTLASSAVFVASMVFVTAGLASGRYSLDHLLLALVAFLCLGVSMVGEYVGAVVVEAKQRPNYLLKQVAAARGASDPGIRPAAVRGGWRA